MCGSEMSGALLSRSILLKRGQEKGTFGQAVCRTLIGETHHCTFSLHTQASLSANHPIHSNDVRLIVLAAIATISAMLFRLWMAMKARWRIAHRYIHTVHLHRDTEQEGT